MKDMILVKDDVDIKERLRSYRLKAQELDYENERIDYIRQSLIPSSPIMDDMPKGSPSSTAMIDKLARIEEIEDRVVKISAYLKEERNNLEGIIEGALRSSDQKAVIRSRYFDLMDWKEVSNIVYGNAGDYEWRKLDYLENTHCLHYRALNSMRRYLENIA